MTRADDIEAIRALAYRYAFLVDGGDWDALADLFGNGGVRPMLRGLSGDLIAGREAVRDFYADNVVLHDGQTRTRHNITNLSVEVDDDRSTGEAWSYFTVLQALRGQDLRMLACGRYHDRFATDDRGRWHFTEKSIHGDYGVDLSQHFRGE